MQSQPDNDLTLELDALQAIGQALARVQDPKTRRRILLWANERFCEAVETPVEIRQSPEDDPALTVDGIEFFGETAPPDPDEMDVSITSNVAAIEALDTSDDDQSLDSLLRAFAGDIRRLATLWQSA